VAAGARHSDFGKDRWEKVAPGLKASTMRWRSGGMLMAFEIAEKTADDEMRKAAMTFVVVGAGPTGVKWRRDLGDRAGHAGEGFPAYRCVTRASGVLDAAPRSCRCLPRPVESARGSCSTSRRSAALGMVEKVDETGDLEHR